MATATLPRRGLPDVEVGAADAEDLVAFAVTTIIKGGMGSSEALGAWGARKVAEAAVLTTGWHKVLEEEGPDEAINHLVRARFRPPRGHRLSNGELGTAFHAAAEEYVLTGVRPTLDAQHVKRSVGPDAKANARDLEVIRAYFTSWERWCQDHAPSFQAAEVVVYNPDLRYAGTTDGFLTLDGVRFVFDYKTSLEDRTGRNVPKRPFADTVALQLAAYGNAPLAAVWRARRFDSYRTRYYLLNAAEQAAAAPVPPVDAGLAIIVTPEQARAYPVELKPEVFRSFLHAAEVMRWREELSRSVMGDELVPAAPPANP